MDITDIIMILKESTFKTKYSIPKSVNYDFKHYFRFKIPSVPQKKVDRNMPKTNVYIHENIYEHGYV